jgi:hypothetical protein
MSERHPSPYVLEVVRHFAADPVISLDRRDAPTHAVVRGVYAGIGAEAVVEFELIDTPPRPSSVRYMGDFEVSAFLPAEVELPWTVFDASLPIDANTERLRAQVRDHVAILGRREAAPLLHDPIAEHAPQPRATREDYGHTQRRPPQLTDEADAAPMPASARAPRSGPPSGPADAPTAPGARPPASVRPGGALPGPKRAPPRRQPPEPPPPPEAPFGFGGVPPSQPPLGLGVEMHVGQPPPPPQRMRPPHSQPPPLPPEPPAPFGGPPPSQPPAALRPSVPPPPGGRLPPPPPPPPPPVPPPPPLPPGLRGLDEA